jgi:purine nucleosidase
MPLRVHIDTDGGVDDALALVALARAGVEIQSVSAVFGNTWVDQAAANARRMLRLSGVAVDVYIGAAAGLAHRPIERRRPGHGLDGMNGAGGSPRHKLPLLERPHGAGILAMEARNGVTGLFLGPLTNLASALLGDPRAFHGWRPVVMAGAFEVEGQGLGGADFNTWSDPEALQRVLLAEVRPRLVPLDVTSQVFLARALFEEAAARTGAPLMRRMMNAAEPYIDVHQKVWGGDGCRPHDAVAAAAALWPELYRFEEARLELDPERFGRLRRAQGPANAEVCVGIEAQEVQGRLARTLFA